VLIRLTDGGRWRRSEGCSLRWRERDERRLDPRDALDETDVRAVRVLRQEASRLRCCLLVITLLLEGLDAQHCGFLTKLPRGNWLE